MGNNSIYILPYYDGDLNKTMDIEDIISIVKGISNDYPNKTIKILVINEFELCNDIYNNDYISKHNITTLYGTTMSHIIAIITSGAIIAMDCDYGYIGAYKPNVLNIHKYIHTEDDGFNKHFIIPVTISDNKFERLSNEIIKNLIEEYCLFNDTIVIGCLLDYYDLFKDEFIQFSKFIEDNYNDRDIHISISNKILQEISNDCYNIICTEDIMNHYNIDYLKDTDEITIINTEDII